MKSDVFGSFLTYLPTLIRYCQMWLDLPTTPIYVCQIFKNLPLLYIMDLVLLFIYVKAN